MQTLISLSLTILALTFLSLPAAAQQKSPAQLLRKRYLSESTGKLRDYYVFLPRGYEDGTTKRWPMILFLHGAGERGDGINDLEKVLIHGPLMEAWIQQRDLPFVMVVPQAPFPDGHANTSAMPAGYAEKRIPGAKIPPRNEAPFDTNPIPEDWGKLRDRPAGAVTNAWLQMEKELEYMLRVTAAEYRVDRKRVSITGLSMGGFGTFGIAAAHPEMFAAIAPICGGGDPDTLDALAQSQRPIWVYHGGRDRTVAPVESLRMVNALIAKGHRNVKLTVHEDLAHNVWTRVYEGEDFYRWLLAQSLP
ncbi:MAG: prolyl oligopeptidase family serine peptidase [Bryobacterales bacterium]|nr:prolyl oligopeptidase family serine peptidase [Bryobacterales bacterium]